MHTNGETWLQRKVLHHHVRTDGTLIIWDVGANVGEWTVYLVEELARRRMTDRVEIHAFEPIETTYSELCRRVDAMGCGANVCVVPKALSNKTETGSMYIVDELAGTNSLYPFGTSSEGSVVTVPAITAETYAEMRGIQRLHLVKCDAEGHDVEVLKGAESLFANRRVDVWQFEYNHRWIWARRYLRDVFTFAHSYDYRVGKVTPNGIELYEAWHPELEQFIEGNYVLVDQDAEGWLGAKLGHFDRFNAWVSSV